MKTSLIQEQEALLAIIKNLPGNYLIVKPDAPRYTIVEVSEAYNLATFTEREKIVGSALFDVFPDDPHDPNSDGVRNLSESLNKVISTNQSHEMAVQRYPVPIPNTDKFLEKFWICINKPVLVRDKLAYIIHSVTDVSKSKQLKSTEAYFKTLADDSPFMIWRSAGASCIYVNAAWTETTGISFEDSLGSGYLKAFHPDDMVAEREKFKAAHQSQSSYESKYRVIDKHGGVRWVFTKVTPNLISGAVIEFIGSIIDITEQETAAQLIIESEQQFRQMADSIIQMIWVTDADGMHEYYNKRWYDFTGTTQQETEGEGWNQVFHPDDQERAWKVWRHSLQTGTPYEIEYRLRKYTGEYIWVLGRAAPYFDSHGKIIKWFGTCTDINEQKLLQQQKDEFINVASHELKTPITGLMANIQFMEKVLSKKTDADPMLTKLVGASYNNARKLNRLVDELLNANSIGLGHLSINKTRFDIVSLVKEVITYLRNDKQPVKLSGLEVLNIFADQGKIEQVIVNLINNAYKYAKDSPFVEVNVSDTEKDVIVKVSDEGPGIPEEKLKFIFERYYQAENSGGRYSGMGLGLYICANIVKNHDGSIGVESHMGTGSTFCFTLPKAGA